MTQPNVPRRDIAAADWMRNFAQLLVDEPSSYFLPPERAAEVMTAVLAYRSALAASLVPVTRTRSHIQAKRDARAEAERVCRHVYAIVRGDRRVTDADKVRLGVRPRKGRRTRSGPPNTRPMLVVTTGLHGHRVIWRDEAALDRKAKPAGCAMLQLFVAVGPTATGDLSKARLVNVYTTADVTLAPEQIGPLVPGTTRPSTPPGAALPVATFFARWAGPRGQPGPWSPPTSVRLVA